MISPKWWQVCTDSQLQSVDKLSVGRIITVTVSAGSLSLAPGIYIDTADL